MDTTVKVGIITVLLVLSISCGLMQTRECLHIHPWWYCLSK